jgi:multiple sugar transport system permease protein
MRKPPNRKLHAQGRLGRILTYAMLASWSFVCLFPLFWVAVTSLKSPPDIDNGPFYFPFADFIPSLDAWTFILTDRYENLLLRYLNSAIAGLTSTALTMVFGGLAVYGLTRFRSTMPLRRRATDLHNRRILFAILATRILPPATIALPLYMMAYYTRTLDTLLALIVTYTASNLPVAVWLLQPVLGKTATEQEEAAQLDGASHLRIFFTIAVPMAKMGIAAAALLIFILCWNEYLFAAYLAGDHAMTVPPWVVGQLSMKEAQAGGDAEEWPRLSAAMVLMAIPVLACTTFIQRFLGRAALWGR